MADVTNKKLQIPGVNSNTNYIQERAYEVNFTNNADISATGTHSLARIAKGEVVTGVKVIVAEAITSGGAATVQVKINGTAINTSAWALSGLSKGTVYSLNANGLAITDDILLQATVGTAAITAGKLIIIVETIPVDMFLK